MEDRVRELEADITRLEAVISEQEISLQTFVSPEENQRLTQQLHEHRSELQKRISEWEHLGQALEA
jgi:hypothetical protein